MQRVFVARLLKKPVGQVTASELVDSSASQGADLNGEEDQNREAEKQRSSEVKNPPSADLDHKLEIINRLEEKSQTTVCWFTSKHSSDTDDQSS